MQLTLHDTAGERTIDAEWSGPVAAHGLWMPRDEDFDGPPAAVARVVRSREWLGGTILAVDLEIGDERGAGLVIFDSGRAVDNDDGSPKSHPFFGPRPPAVYVEAAPDGKSYFDDEETEVARADSTRPLAEIAATGKWLKSTGRSWVGATEYLADHPETEDRYYTKSTETFAEPSEVDDL